MANILWGASLPAKLTRKEITKRYRDNNREKCREASRAWLKKRKRTPLDARHFDLNRTYGPGASEHFDAQTLAQHGRCDCCGIEFPDVPHFDHNHLTHQFRGLLCRKCNIGLHYLENKTWYENATKYLDRWNQRGLRNS